MKKVGWILSAVAIIAVVSIAYTFNNDSNKISKLNSKNKSEVESTNESKDLKSNKEDKEDFTTDKNNESIKDNNDKKETKNSEIKSEKFKVVSLENEYNPTFNTPWKTSPGNKQLKACIEGKGPNAIEEGKGTIYIKSPSDNKMYSIEPINVNPNFTVKYINWWDDDHLLVILGTAYGTVGKGGELYITNISNAKSSLIQGIDDGKVQVVSAVRDGDTVKAKTIEYIDDNFNEYKESEKVFSKIQIP